MLLSILPLKKPCGHKQKILLLAYKKVYSMTPIVLKSGN